MSIVAVFDVLIVVVPLAGIGLGVVLTLLGVWPVEDRRGGMIDLTGKRPKTFESDWWTRLR